MSLNPKKFAKALFIDPLKFYYDILIGLGALRVENIDMEDEHTVLINDFYENLYCVEIAGAGESVSYFPNTLIDSLCNKFGDIENAEMTWVLIKDGIFRRNMIFTRNKELAYEINKSSPSRLLTFDEIFNRLISLYFNNEYEVDIFKRELKQKYSIDLEDINFINPINQINSLIKERVNENYKKVDWYQAVSYNNTLKEDDIKFDINSFFNIDFKGALFTKIIFNRQKIKGELEFQKFNSTMLNFSSKDKKVLEKLIDMVEAGKKVLINSTLMVYESKSDVSTLVAKCSSSVLDKVSRNFRSLTNKTPILSNNRSFSRVVNSSFLYNYIGFNTKLDSDKPHLVGTNYFDTYTNFGFKKATAVHSIPKPHTFIIGTSGAGKTQAANNILAQLLGYDYTTGEIHHTNETEHIIFDIKKSFYHLVHHIKKHNPDLVDINTFDKNEFSYNIVDCDKRLNPENKRYEISQEDIDFSATLVSMILSANKSGENEALNSSEMEEYKSALRNTYSKDTFDRLPISSIRDTHATEYRELRVLGYPEHTPFDEIKESKYEKFKKPLLHNIINYLKQKESEYRTNNKVKESEMIASLTFKLETIFKMTIFSNFSKLDFQEKKIIYFETDSIVGGNDYGYLIFAMQSILAKISKKKQDAKRINKQDRPLIFFWYEEARNIFSNNLFKEEGVFDRSINEWRSYDMVFMPITQEAQHIPDAILNGFEVKIILASGDDEDEKKTLIENLSRRISIGDKRKDILKMLPKYTMLILYGDGAFTMKFKNDENFRNLVNT